MGIIQTRCDEYHFTHTTDKTSDDLARTPTATPPSGNGVINCAQGGVMTFNALDLVFVGTGANDAVMTAARVYGWRPLYKSGLPPLWIPKILADFAGVFGNVTGVANTALSASYFFMDTLTLTSGNANISNEIISLASEKIAHAIVDTKGHPFIEVTFDLGANATALNCLWSGL